MQPFLTTNGNMAEGRHSLTSIHPHIATSVDFRVVVHDVNLHIPLTWPIQTFHGRENEQFTRNSTLMPFIESNKIILMRMNVTYDREQSDSLLTNPNV